MAVVICRSCGRYNRAEDLSQRGFACEMCGQIVPVADIPLTSVPAVPHEPPVQFNPPESLYSVYTKYKTIWTFSVGGLLCIVLGVSMMTSRAFREDSKHLSLSELLAGLGVTALGVGMMGYAVFTWFRR
jgi:hypothetical protein